MHFNFSSIFDSVANLVVTLDQHPLGAVAFVAIAVTCAIVALA